MNIINLATMVQTAITIEPPQALRDYCGNYYQPYYHLLYLLAKQTKHKCVELGVEKGRGTLAMALSGNEVVAIDHTRRPEADELRRQYKNITFLEQSSLPPTVGGPIGLLHVDTEHSYAQAREEFWAYKDLLSIPAFVCFDDTHAKDYEVGKFVTTLPWPTIFDDRLHKPGYAVMLYTGDR